MKLFQVDAFTKTKFKGNPAGVCIVDQPLGDAQMQAIAAEMNLAETAFVQLAEPVNKLRWFTPTVEVELCGHATLSTAHILYERDYVEKENPIRFQTASGVLTTSFENGVISMDFPAIPAEDISVPEIFREIFASNIIAAAEVAKDFVLEFESEQAVRQAAPQMDLLKKHSRKGVIITASSSGDPYDFVSRYFAHHVGIDEDPVTGYAHCVLTPFWHKRLHKEHFKAYQASRRGGALELQLKGERVVLKGFAVTVFATDIEV